MLLSSSRKCEYARGSVLLEFALGLILFLPLLIFFYLVYEVYQTKSALETCAYVSAEAAATFARPISPADIATLKVLCQHGNPDSNTPLLHPALSDVMFTVQETSLMLLTASGDGVAYPLLSISVSVPFVSAIFPAGTAEKYLPVSDFSIHVVRSFYAAQTTPP